MNNNMLPLKSNQYFHNTNLEVVELNESYCAYIEGNPDLYLSFMNLNLYDHIDAATNYTHINDLKIMMAKYIPYIKIHNDISKYKIKKLVHSKILVPV